MAEVLFKDLLTDAGRPEVARYLDAINYLSGDFEFRNHAGDVVNTKTWLGTSNIMDYLIIKLNDIGAYDGPDDYYLFILRGMIHHDGHNPSPSLVCWNYAAAVISLLAEIQKCQAVVNKCNDLANNCRGAKSLLKGLSQRLISDTNSMDLMNRKIDEVRSREVTCQNQLVRSGEIMKTAKELLYSLLETAYPSRGNVGRITSEPGPIAEIAMQLSESLEIPIISSEVKDVIQGLEKCRSEIEAELQTCSIIPNDDAVAFLSIMADSLTKTDKPTS